MGHDEGTVRTRSGTARFDRSSYPPSWRELSNRHSRRRGWERRFIFFDLGCIAEFGERRRLSLIFAAPISNHYPPPTHEFRSSRSPAMKRAKTTEITPFVVKKAALRRERSSALTRECS